jgi:2-keto-4-pentenoate hydratase/2-oxohepta-3-ene-1,7-dioic acid hydratase in catechol pathway
MRWLTYRHDGVERVGMLDEADTVHGLAPGPTMLDLLRSHDGLNAHADSILCIAEHTAPIADVVVCAPLQPPSVPCFYFTNAAAVLGPTDDVAIFPGSQQFDYELEVGAVIGRAGRDIPRDKAGEHIAGYTILCDWSARDLQLAEMPMGAGPAKGKDGATTLGPWLVTPDELEPYRAGKGFALTMTASVNGDEISQGRWDSIDWDFADMIAYTCHRNRHRSHRVPPRTLCGPTRIVSGVAAAR